MTELQHDNLKGLDVSKEMTEVRRCLELKTLTCWKRNPTNLPSCYRQGWTKQREDLYDGVQSNTIAIQYTDLAQIVSQYSTVQHYNSTTNYSNTLTINCHQNFLSNVLSLASLLSYKSTHMQLIDRQANYVQSELDLFISELLLDMPTNCYTT